MIYITLVVIGFLATLGWFYLYIFVLIIYAHTIFIGLHRILALYITTQAPRTLWLAPFVELTQIQLKSSLFAVSQLYGPVEPLPIWFADRTEFVSSESTVDRLNVGSVMSCTGGHPLHPHENPTPMRKGGVGDGVSALVERAFGRRRQELLWPEKLDVLFDDIHQSKTCTFPELK